MARPSKFNEETILDAALDEGRRAGFERLSASSVAKRLGAPSGSLYHRYPSRDALMAALWLRAVERFQAGYLEIIKGEGPPLVRARAAARFVFDWCCKHPAEAQLLLRYRREDLLTGKFPRSVSQRAATLNHLPLRGLRRLAHELCPMSPDFERVRFVCVSIPMAAVRDSLVAGKQPCDSMAQLLDEAVVALLATTGK